MNLIKFISSIIVAQLLCVTSTFGDVAYTKETTLVSGQALSAPSTLRNSDFNTVSISQIHNTITMQKTNATLDRIE